VKRAGDKARLVAGGNQQVMGIDVNDVFAPTVRCACRDSGRVFNAQVVRRIRRETRTVRLESTGYMSVECDKASASNRALGSNFSERVNYRNFGYDLRISNGGTISLKDT
jgi:hypothetical protein